MKIGVYGRLFLVVLGIICGLLFVHFRLTLGHLAGLADELDQRIHLELARDLRGTLAGGIADDLTFTVSASPTLAAIHRGNADLELYLVDRNGRVTDRSPAGTALSRVAITPIEHLLSVPDPPLPTYLAATSPEGGDRVFSAARVTTAGRSGYMLVLTGPSAAAVAGEGAVIIRVLRRLAVGFLLTGLCSLSAVGLTVWLLSRQFRALLNGIDEFRQGRPRPVPILGTGEASYLARRYNEVIAQLEERRGELLQIEQSRRALVANLVHDLRTPLGAVQGFLGLLVRRTPEPDAGRRAHYIDTALVSAHAHRALLESLADLAALDAKEQEPERVPCRIASIIEAVTERFEPRAAEKKLSFCRELSGELPAVAVDRPMLERVIANILSNAIRYTPAGGTITVRAEGEGGGVRVSVSDTGIGIPAEKQPHIFDEFYRAHRGLPEDSGGTGLGLGIVRRILALHGTVPEVESSVGEGTRFSFLLGEGDDAPAQKRIDTAEERGGGTPPVTAEASVLAGPRLILQFSLLIFAIMSAVGKLLISGYEVPWRFAAVLVTCVAAEACGRRMRIGPPWLPRSSALAALALWGAVSGFYVPLELGPRGLDSRSIYETALLYLLPLTVPLLPQFRRKERIAFSGAFALGSVWTFVIIWRTELISFGVLCSAICAICAALSIRRDTLATRLGAAIVGVVGMIGFFQGYQATTIWSQEVGEYEHRRGARLLAAPIDSLARDLCVAGADTVWLLRKAGMLLPARRISIVSLERTPLYPKGKVLSSGGVFYANVPPLERLDPLPSSGAPELVRVAAPNNAFWQSELVTPPLCGDPQRRVTGLPRSPFAWVLERQLAEKHLVIYLVVSSLQTFALSAALALALLLGVARRLNVVAEVAGCWQRGELSRRIPALGHDEVGALATQFNVLAEATEREHQRVRDADEQRRLFVEAIADGLGPPCAHTVAALTELKGEIDSGVVPGEAKLRALAGEVTSQIRLVNDLFEFSKIESEQRAPELERFSLAEVASDSVGELKPRADARGISIELEVCRGDVPAYGDIGAVSRAFELMLGVAVGRAAAPGAVRVVLARAETVRGCAGAAEIHFQPAEVGNGQAGGSRQRAAAIELLVAARLLERSGAEALFEQSRLRFVLQPEGRMADPRPVTSKP